MGCPRQMHESSIRPPPSGTGVEKTKTVNAVPALIVTLLTRAAEELRALIEQLFAMGVFMGHNGRESGQGGWNLRPGRGGRREAGEIVTQPPLENSLPPKTKALEFFFSQIFDHHRSAPCAAPRRHWALRCLLRL